MPAVAKTPFLKPMPLPSLDGPVPQMTVVASPEKGDKLVSVKYLNPEGKCAHEPGSLTVTSRRANYIGEDWRQMSGTLEDAVQAANHLAYFRDDDWFQKNEKGVASVAILDAGKGVYQLLRNRYTEGLGDGMDAIITMPIDRVSQKDADISYPTGWTAPETRVRLNDPRVVAVVGTDVWVRRDQ